jgi:hypothetical protein
MKPTDIADLLGCRECPEIIERKLDGMFNLAVNSPRDSWKCAAIVDFVRTACDLHPTK